MQVSPIFILSAYVHCQNSCVHLSYSSILEATAHYLIFACVCLTSFILHASVLYSTPYLARISILHAYFPLSCMPLFLPCLTCLPVFTDPASLCPPAKPAWLCSLILHASVPLCHSCLPVFPYPACHCLPATPACICSLILLASVPLSHLHACVRFSYMPLFPPATPLFLSSSYICALQYTLS